LDYCTNDPAGFTKLADELRALLARKISVVMRVYPCNSPTERRWFFLIGLPLAGHDRAGIALLHINLTPFLALSVGESSEVTSDGVGKQIDFTAVAKSVEASSLDALASQVIQMLGIKPAPRRQQAEQRARQALDLAGLSKRQLEILGHLAEGKTNTEIAHELSRSPHTIKLHVSAILKHLRVKSRTQAAILASQLVNEDAEQRSRPLRGGFENDTN
jgi:DNA-binding CsgD family transcriptional regulator